MRRIGTGVVMLSAGVVVGVVVSGGLSSGAGQTASAASPSPSSSPAATESPSAAVSPADTPATAESATASPSATRKYTAAQLAAAAQAAERATSTYRTSEGSSINFGGQSLPDLTVVPPERTDGALKLTVGLGDSITYRAGSWFRRVCGAGVLATCRDAGIRGDTTTGMLERLQTDVLDLKPDVVTIMAGTNDMMHGYTTARTMRNLDSLVTQSQDAGITVVLCTVAPRHKTAEQALALNVAIRKYAKKNDVALLDLYPVIGTSAGRFKKGLTDDGVHPNAKGMRLMSAYAETRLPALIG